MYYYISDKIPRPNCKTDCNSCIAWPGKKCVSDSLAFAAMMYTVLFVLVLQKGRQKRLQYEWLFCASSRTLWESQFFFYICKVGCMLVELFFSFSNCRRCRVEFKMTWKDEELSGIEILIECPEILSEYYYRVSQQVLESKSNRQKNS